MRCQKLTKGVPRRPAVLVLLSNVFDFIGSSDVIELRGWFFVRFNEIVQIRITVRTLQALNRGRPIFERLQHLSNRVSLRSLKVYNETFRAEFQKVFNLEHDSLSISASVMMVVRMVQLIHFVSFSSQRVHRVRQNTSFLAYFIERSYQAV